MNNLLKKLNYKFGSIHLFNAPPEVKTLFEHENLSNETISKSTSFGVFFAVTLDDVKQQAKVAAENILPDPILWFCYPKSTSKNYKCEFNRDSGWQVLGDIGLEPVRQVSINEDWSALRFRKVENIKNMVRTFAMTKEGKLKSKGVNT